MRKPNPMIVLLYIKRHQKVLTGRFSPIATNQIHCEPFYLFLSLHTFVFELLAALGLGHDSVQ
jgi:hypothetical protein